MKWPGKPSRTASGFSATATWSSCIATSSKDQMSQYLVPDLGCRLSHSFRKYSTIAASPWIIARKMAYCRWILWCSPRTVSTSDIRIGALSGNVYRYVSPWPAFLVQVEWDSLRSSCEAAQNYAHRPQGRLISLPESHDYLDTC